MEPQDLIDALRNRARKFVSLDTPQDSDLADLAIDIGAGFLPVIGTAQAGRDFERARREDDMLGMALSSLGALPVIGGVTQGVNRARKAKKAVGTVFDNVTDYDEALQMALRGEHLKRTPTGKYVGAPEDVDSPQKLARNRINASRKVEAGAFNANWYDRARDAASDVSGYSPTVHGYGTQTPEARMASLFARSGAAYSPQATPEMEIGAMLRQHNAKVLRGEDVAPRTGSQARNVANAYAPDPAGGYVIDPSKIRLGKKTGPYGDAKDPTIPPEALYKTANDIWHGRVMGYGDNFSRGFTPQEHGFLTGENLVLANDAQRRGFGANVLPEGYQWNPRSAQTSTWGAQRLTSYQKEYDNAVRKALREGKKPPPAPTQEQLLARASYGIDSAVPRYTANDTFEFVTGENTGHLAGLNRADDATRRAYTDDMGEAYLRTPSGAMRDPIYDSFQMFQRNALPTEGVYVNSAGVVERNPGFTSRPLVSLRSSDLGVTAKGKPRRGGPETVPEDENAMRAAGQLRGLITAQEGTGRNKFTPANNTMKASEKTGVRYTGNDLDAARAAYEKQGLDVVQVGDALHVGKFPGDNGNPTMSAAEIQKLAKAAEGEVTGKSVAGRWETGLEMVPWTKEQGTGQTTRQVLETLMNDPKYYVQDAAKRIDAGRLPKAAGVMNEIDAALSKKTGMPVREDLMKLRDMLSKQGLQGVIDYVKKTGGVGLPAVALVPSLSFLAEQQGDREQ
ncbi:MAG: hypothetical protein EB117_13800 [Betaproteobacteria bacterium]|nr:hypothetical protein [Betaproteobacteria bacterium]